MHPRRRACRRGHGSSMRRISAGRRRHAGRDLPACLRAHTHCRLKTEPPALRVEEKVRPVEQQKVRTRPAMCVVEAVGQIVEAYRHLARAARSDPPGVLIDLVPAEGVTRLLGGEARDVSSKVRDLVRSRCPRGERQDDRRVSSHGKRHRRRHRASRRVRARERDLIADVGKWCGSRGGLCRGSRRLNERGQQRWHHQEDLSSHLH